jgi:hypothetical protein
MADEKSPFEGLADKFKDYVKEDGFDVAKAKVIHDINCHAMNHLRKAFAPFTGEVKPTPHRQMQTFARGIKAKACGLKRDLETLRDIFNLNYPVGMRFTVDCCREDTVKTVSRAYRKGDEVRVDIRIIDGKDKPISKRMAIAIADISPVEPGEVSDGQSRP